MLTSHSIHQLYPLALTEGEGVGTAYEYYVKRRALKRWLSAQNRPRSLLIAGLPQKYGSSLDFFLLADELACDLVVIDERPEALEKGKQALAAMQKQGWMTGVNPEWRQVERLEMFEPAGEPFDLVICSEVLQRQPVEKRPAYAAMLRQAGRAAAVFCPNKDNESHVGISGLEGVRLAEMEALFPHASAGGYIDMPPFPPGITRSDEQREQATSGRMEALAMWGLGVYARAEQLIPLSIRRRQAHIVYALTTWQQA